MPDSLTQLRKLWRGGDGQGVKVAILDSGVEISHPQLAGLRLTDDVAVVESAGKFSAAKGEGGDLFGHGTAVCSLIHRLAPAAEIGSFRVLGEQCRSRSAIVRVGARLALERGYHILNCSFGCSREDHVLYYKDWVDEAYLRGAHVVAACNNEHYARREWPGHFPSVITVDFTATAADALHYRRGTLVEFLAAGQDIEVAWRDGAMKRVTGSSFACAHAAGLLARLISAQLQKPSTLEGKAQLQQLAAPWEQAGTEIHVLGRISQTA